MSAPDTLLPPSACADAYRPQQVLGTGGFATVWLAKQVKLDRLVALKVLHRDHLADPDMVARFRDEARITAALVDPRIVRVIDHGVDDGVPWIVYELINGKTVRDLLNERGRFGVAEALEVCEQVATALAAAHAAGVLHRDIKPENVMQSEEGAFKVTDFGIARWTGSRRDQTQAGVILGTPTYVAPERIRGESASAASDIYALGVMLFELLAGRPPFQADEPTQVLSLHLEAPAPSLRDVVPSAPESIDRIVRHALAKAPADRFATAGAFAEALRSARDRAGERAPGEERRAPRDGSGAGFERRRSTDRTARVAPRGTRSEPVLDDVVPPRANPVGPLVVGALILFGLGVRVWWAPEGPSASGSAPAVTSAPLSIPPMRSVEADPAIAEVRVVPLEPAMRADLIARLSEMAKLEDLLDKTAKEHDKKSDVLGIPGFDGNTVAGEFAEGKPLRQQRREWLSKAPEAEGLRAEAPSALRLADLFRQISARAGTELAMQAPLVDGIGSMMDVLWYLGLTSELNVLRRVIRQASTNVTPSWMTAYLQAREGLLAAQAGEDAGEAETWGKSALKLLELEARGAGKEAEGAKLHARLLVLNALREIHRAKKQPALEAEREQACRALLAWPWPGPDPTGLAARTRTRITAELGVAKKVR